jgi:hypothetical protein
MYQPAGVLIQTEQIGLACFTLFILRAIFFYRRKTLFVLVSVQILPHITCVMLQID